MNRDPRLDTLARRLIQASDQELRHYLGVPQLDPALVALLYLLVRGVLEHCPEEEGAVDELALAMYLTASTWHSTGDLPVDLLNSLHSAIGPTLHRELTAAAANRPSDGASS